MALESTKNLGLADGAQKVLAELQGLNLSVVTGAAGGTQIPLVGIESEDTIKSVLNMTDLTELVPTDFTITDRRARGTLTIQAGLLTGATVTINGKVYTFSDAPENITTNVAPGVVPITNSGAVNTTTVAARLAKVIMSNDSSLFASASGAVVTVYVRTPGTAGNSTTLVTSGAGVVVSGATFTLGTATQGFAGANSTATKKLLVAWYNKQ